MVRTRIEVYPDITEMIAFFEQLPDYDISLFTNKKAKTDAEKSLVTLKELLPLLEAAEDFTNDGLFEMLKTYAQEKGCKINSVMWPLRIAVSGQSVTPAGATEIMDILGKNESIARIHIAINKLEA